VTRPPDSLRTARLLLRPWRDADLAPFRAMNADPEVMRFFAKPLSGDESDAVARRLMGFFDEGLGPWAVEVPGEAPFIGFVGAWRTRAELPFAPAVEVGWRLARPFWGRGYAPEAARAALADAFARLDLDEVVAYAAAANAPSIAVMRRLGMAEDAAGGFDHPGFPEADPNRRSVLFRLSRDAFLRGRAVS
jgi:ribosomal-protein-alanine N-acetyltransferase